MTNTTSPSAMSRYSRTFSSSADLNLSDQVNSPACQELASVGIATHVRKNVVQYTVYQTLVTHTLLYCMGVDDRDKEGGGCKNANKYAWDHSGP